MKEKLFISASELAEMLEISRSHAYKYNLENRMFSQN